MIGRSLGCGLEVGRDDQRADWTNEFLCQHLIVNPGIGPISSGGYFHRTTRPSTWRLGTDRAVSSWKVIFPLPRLCDTSLIIKSRSCESHFLCDFFACSQNAGEECGAWNSLSLICTWIDRVSRPCWLKHWQRSDPRCYSKGCVTLSRSYLSPDRFLWETERLDFGWVSQFHHQT